MKKNILLTVMFITLFFIGSNNVFAQLECQVGEENCSIDEINKDISKVNSDSRIVCLYEVELDNGEKYYNYIFYSNNANKIYAGTTLGSNDGYQELKKGDNPYLLGDAYEALYNNNQCPEKSYLDDYQGFNFNTNEICFDNDDGECKNNGKKLNTETDFNITSSSKLKGENTDVLKYKSVTFKNSCDENNLPDGYENVCRYKNLSTGDYVLLLYNNSTSELIYNQGSSGMRAALEKNESKSLWLYGDYYNKYTNKITSSINSCPTTIYLNKYETEENVHTAITTYNYALELTKGGEESAVLKIFDCDTETTAVETPYENCDDIINDELREIINEIMSVIRIAVPILLIALITYDFAMAVFAGADDKVRKARDRAIKRVIIAIAIFFVPTFINLVFDLVNDVWGKHYEICGINQDNQ